MREVLLLIEKPWKKPVAMFAAPRPIISWFGSTYAPLLAARLRESTLVSAKETTAIAIAPSQQRADILQAEPTEW